MSRMNADGSNTHRDLIWIEIKLGLNDAFNRIPMKPKRRMELYTHVFNFCTSQSSGTRQIRADSGGAELYRKLKEFIKGYVVRILDQGCDKYGENMLNFYTKEWQEYKFSAKVVDRFFSYMNRKWVKQEMDEGYEEIYFVYELCLVLWKDGLTRQLKDRVVEAAFELIQKERRGEAIEKELISKVIKSFAEFGLDDLKERINMAE